MKRNFTHFNCLTHLTRSTNMHSFRVSLISALLLLCNLTLSANDYHFTGDDNESGGDWGDDLMLVSPGGYYMYYENQTDLTGEDVGFDIEDRTDGITYDRSYVVPGFNGTDILTLTTGASGDCILTSAPASYYVIFWLAGTPFNTTGKPVICASTTLPDDASGDEVIYSATCIVSANVSIASGATNQPIAADQATITGGTMSVTNKHGSAKDLLRPNIGPTGDKRSAFYLNGNKEYFTVALTSPKVLAVGDVISAQIRLSSSDVGAGCGLWFTRSTTTTRPGSAPTEKAVTTTTDEIWYNVSYTVAAGDNLVGQSTFNIYRGTEKSTAFTNFVITRPAASSCEAPASVSVTGTWDYFGGETITLEASYSGGVGSPSYQWQKLINSTWTDLANGTVSGATFSGVETANLRIANCGFGNSGKYRCIVSTGSGCETASATATDGSEGYGVKVYALECYTGGTTVYNFTRVGNSQAGTLTINIPANSTYQFKVHADNDYYGKDYTFTKDETYKVLSTSDPNLQIYSGLGGTFVITMDYGTAGSSSTEGVPELSVTYPRKVIYLQLCSDWKAAVAKYEIYYWKGGDNGWSGFMDTYACNGDIRYAEVPAWATNCMFIRFDGSKSTPGSWSDEWNRTGDLNLSTSNDYYYSLSKGGDNKYYGTWDTFAPTTYSISFAGNGNTGGSMSNMVVNCGDDATLTAHTFTKTAYVFTGWKADVAVTINGSSVSAGTLIADGATLQNVTSDIALTAQWEENPMATIPGTVNKGNMTNVSDDKWFSGNTDYYNFGDDYGVDGSSGTNLDRYIEWDVELLSAGNYLVSEETYCLNGHTYLLELWDGGTLKSSYTTEDCEWGAGYQSCTQDALWNLSSVPVGQYKLRVKNATEYGKPKLKSLTFTAVGLSFTYTKTPDRALYGDEGDTRRAHGTIDDAVVTASGIENGATVSVSGNVLTIGSVTITAPLVTNGKLYDIPKDDPEASNEDDCIWRFDHWENVPATITGNIDDVVAVYFPSFLVEYETFGGTINDDPYYTWYRYTGREEDSTPLPMNVTKPGFVFGGWYQVATTELFTRLPGHYYGGYVGKWCLKAHWLLPCEESQIISKVTLTGTSSYETGGYDDGEYVGSPVISVSGTTAAYDVNGDGNAETGYELGTAGDHVFVTVVDGFRVGDTICVAITAPNTVGRISSSANYLDIFYRASNGTVKKLTHIKDVVTGPGIYKYALSADDVDDIEEAGAASVGVYRLSDGTGQNPCVYSVEIHGCRDLVFDDNNGTHVWSDPKNWAPFYSDIPSYHQSTRIVKPCVVDIDDAQAKNVKLCREYTGHNGSLDIRDTAALEVTQRISEVRGLDYNTLYAVAPANLVVRSSATHQGAVAHGDTGDNTGATIEFYGRGAGYGGANPTWQYMGVPFSDASHAIDHYYGSEMCRWYENETGNAGENWKWVEKPEALLPFIGYALTNPSAKVFTNQGTLVPSVNQTISLTCDGTNYKGWNFLANSWMAPINITKFIASDFGSAQQTIYLFNTGINDGHQTTQPETTSAGQYVAVPILSAGSMLADNRYIAPMQGFYMVTESATSMTLRYNLVRNDEHEALSTRPNRAPRMASGDENDSQMPRIIVDVTGNRFSDRLYLFENIDQTNAFDNGWDGYKFEGEDYAPQLMTRTGDMDLAVDVSPAFDGKQIAFRAGEDAEYTLHFSSTETGLVLRDLVTDVVTPIEDGGSYHFFASNRESAIRFIIGDNRQVPTGFGETGVSADQILSLTVYTADGRLVLRRTTDFDDPLLLPQSGVYIFYVQTTAGVKIQKITF